MQRATTTVKLRGFISEIDEEHKKIKILYNSDVFTRNFVKRHVKQDIHNPVFYDGFWVKYSGKSQYYTIKNNRCTLQEILKNHVILEVSLYNYSYTNRTGWYLLCKSIILDI